MKRFLGKTPYPYHSTYIGAMNNYQKALSLARGSYQRAIVEGSETLGGSTLRGKARKYAGRYRRSVENLLSRLDAAGVEYDIKFGPWRSNPSAVLTFPE